MVSLASEIITLKHQEEVLRFSAFAEREAWSLGVLLRDLALKNNLPLVIDIRIGARPLFYVAMPGTTPENPDWVRRKINTAMRFEKSTYRVGREFLERGVKVEERMGMNPIDFVDAGGSFPIHIIGTGIVGTVTVSGIPQRDDHNFVVQGIAAFLGVDLTSVALGADET
jgi:uncharacterized protein (UPF0303 family)